MVKSQEFKQKATHSDNKLLNKEFIKYLRNLLFLITGTHPRGGRRIKTFLLVGSTFTRLLMDISNPSGNAASLTQDSTTG
jgi:hypothetical protein